MRSLSTKHQQVKDFTPLIAWRREVQKRKCLVIYLERLRKGHHHFNKHWNCFRSNTGKTAERWSGAPVGFSEHIDTILN